jgi:hypothetical protein
MQLTAKRNAPLHEVATQITRRLSDYLHTHIVPVRKL